jgi:hypothetical protein
MCLVFTASRGHAKRAIKVAKEAITVYKVVDISNKSRHQGFQYTPNTLYKLGKPLKPIHGYTFYRTRSSYDVYDGFHSYTNYQTARSYCYCKHNNLKVVKFYIPKGAKYIVGNAEDHEIVSTSIRSGDLKEIT